MAVKDKSLMWVRLEHPSLTPEEGYIHLNLMNITTNFEGDTMSVGEAGAGGGRVITQNSDIGKWIKIEVNNNTKDENVLARLEQFKGVPCTRIDWEDAMNPLAVQGGSGVNCWIKPGDNDRSADTRTFEFYCDKYQGN